MTYLRLKEVNTNERTGLVTYRIDSYADQLEQDQQAESAEEREYELFKDLEHH